MLDQSFVLGRVEPSSAIRPGCCDPAPAQQVRHLEVKHAACLQEAVGTIAEERSEAAALRGRLASLEAHEEERGAEVDRLVDQVTCVNVMHALLMHHMKPAA